MNLKKIIREEIKSDFQWIKDTESDELILSPNISFRDDDEMRKIIKDVFDYDDEEIDEDLLFNLATEQGYRWSEKHQGWWHLSERVDLESIKESNDLQWIKDIKSNKDMAEELFNQTVITKDKGIVKFPFMTDNIHPKRFYFDLSIIKKYGKDKNSDDIWERYKVLVNNRLKELRPENLKESDDLQWIKDTKSDEDIAQEFVNNTKIVKGTNGNFTIQADNYRHYSFNFKANPIEDFAYDYAPHFIVQLKSNYGITDINHISRIWKRYQEGLGVRTAKEFSIHESKDFDWIKDIDSKVDEETIDILYNKPFYWYSPLSPNKWVTFQGMPKIFWLEDGIDSAEVKVCTHKHNKEGFYTKDCNQFFKSTVVKKFDRGVYVLQPKLTNINESKNDFGWVDEIPQYDFHNGEYYIDISELDDDEACEVQQTLINMGIDWREGNGKINKLHCSTFTNKGYIIRRAVLYRTTKSYDDYRDKLFHNTPWDAVYIDGRTDLLC